MGKRKRSESKRTKGNQKAKELSLYGVVNFVLMRSISGVLFYMFGEDHTLTTFNPLGMLPTAWWGYIEGCRPSGRIECNGTLNGMRNARRRSRRFFFTETVDEDEAFLEEWHNWSLLQPEVHQDTQPPWYSDCLQTAALLASLNGDVEQVATYVLLLLHNPSIAALLEKSEAYAREFVELMVLQHIVEPYKRHLEILSPIHAMNKAFFELQRMMGDVFVLLHLNLQRDTTVPSVFYGGGAHVARLWSMLAQYGWSVVWGKLQEPDKGSMIIPEEVLSRKYTGEKAEVAEVFSRKYTGEKAGSTTHVYRFCEDLLSYEEDHIKLSQYFNKNTIRLFYLVEISTRTDEFMRRTMCDVLAHGFHWSPSVASRVMAAFMLLPHDVFRRFVSHMYDFVSHRLHICFGNAAYILMAMLHGPPAMQWTACDAQEEHLKGCKKLSLGPIRACLASIPPTDGVIHVPEKTVKETKGMDRLTHETVLCVEGTYYKASNVSDRYTQEVYDAIYGPGSYFLAKHSDDVLRAKLMKYFF